MPEQAIQPVGHTLQEWVQRLTEEEMPIFAQTVGEINRILATEEYSSLALARVILQDPSMTAKVLKLSNSAFFNPGGAAISTVSRSVVVLGFNVVQAICISIAVIESLVRGRVKDRVMRELARSIHAATQARSMANANRDSHPEEVFIAGLLASLGQMAFWCFAGDDGKRLDLALANEAGEASEIERTVLGFKLTELTAELALEWKLTPLVGEFLKGKASRDPRTKYIDLGQRIAREVEHGWNSPEVRNLAAEVGKLIGRPASEVGPMLQNNAQEAVERAKTMGAGAAARLIPVFGKNSGDEESTWAEEGNVPVWCEPDPMLQLKILREITMTLGGKPDLSVLLEMVLEGIHRGVGMDRTVLALVSPRRNLVRAKHALGVGRLKILDNFEFELGVKTQNLFQRLMDSKEAAWVHDYDDNAFSGVLHGKIFEVIDQAHFIAQPVSFNGVPIGMFYADRHPSGRVIESDTFESFKLFVHQANLGLEHIARQRVAAA